METNFWKKRKINEQNFSKSGESILGINIWKKQTQFFIETEKLS